MGFWIKSQCPNCGKSIDIRMYGLTTGLGPSTIRCCGCDRLIRTNRREFTQMETLHLTWLLLSSAIFVLGVGLLGGISMGIARSFWRPVSWTDKLAFSEFFSDALLWGALTIALQFYRIIRSLLRTKDEPFPCSYWNLQLDVQGKVGDILLGIPVISWLLSLVFGP